MMLPGLNEEHTICVPGRDFSMNLIGLELKKKRSTRRLKFDIIQCNSHPK